MTYFAVKTRQQELIENYDILSEEQKRLAIRAEMVEHNKSLAEAAKQAGVETPQEYAVFQNKGYQGLYGGLGMRDIHARKGLKPNEKILDHMGSTELAANLFRATRIDEKLRRENIQGKDAANETHYRWPQGAPDHCRAGRHHAGGFTRARKEHQADPAGTEEAGQRERRAKIGNCREILGGCFHQQK